METCHLETKPDQTSQNRRIGRFESSDRSIFTTRRTHHAVASLTCGRSAPCDPVPTGGSNRSPVTGYPVLNHSKVLRLRLGNFHSECRVNAPLHYARAAKGQVSGQKTERDPVNRRIKWREVRFQRSSASCRRRVSNRGIHDRCLLVRSPIVIGIVPKQGGHRYRRTINHVDQPAIHCGGSQLGSVIRPIVRRGQDGFA